MTLQNYAFSIGLLLCMGAVVYQVDSFYKHRFPIMKLADFVIGVALTTICAVLIFDPAVKIPSEDLGQSSITLATAALGLFFFGIAACSHWRKMERKFISDVVPIPTCLVISVGAMLMYIGSVWLIQTV